MIAEVRTYGERGLREALSLTGKALVVAGVIAAAIKVSELGRQLVFASVMADNIRGSVGLITKIPNSLKSGLARQIWRLARGREGINIDKLQKLLMDRYKLSESDSRRIAIDQDRKYRGGLAEARQAANGVREYMWETMKDERVRPNHRTKQGRVFAWKSPPPDTGHPGESINCRCKAIPIIRKK